MAYKSRYEEQLANALNKITSREKFNYDFNADPMYQAYKDQYTKLGNEAAANAAANVSALTGGYGNSYAATAASQANQQYLTKLNEQIPALNQQALNKYMMEGDELNNLYNMLSEADAKDYAKYRDDIADAQWQAQFDENKRRYDQEWAASQAAQTAAQALINSQKNTNVAKVKETPKEETKKTVETIKATKADVQKAARTVSLQEDSQSARDENFGAYLDNQVSAGKMTQKEADLYFKQYKKNLL